MDDVAWILFKRQIPAAGRVEALCGRSAEVTRGDGRFVGRVVARGRLQPSCRERWRKRDRIRWLQEMRRTKMTEAVVMLRTELMGLL